MECALQIGDASIPKPWSKYSRAASHTASNEPAVSAYELKKQAAEKLKEELQRKRDLLFSIYDDKNNAELSQYLASMKSKSKTKTWINEEGPALKGNVKISTVPNKKPGGKDMLVPKVHVTFDDSGSDNDEEYQDVPNIKSYEDSEPPSVSADISDMEYMKMKMHPIADPLEEELEDVNEAEVVSDKEESKADILDTSSAKKELNVNMIAETGRVFVRNLPYSCSEDDLRSLFEKYGPLAEIHLPISKETKISKGFAHIMYMIPENAITAYSELDGSIFQGRILHILPSYEKPEKKIEESEEGSFKQKKEMKINSMKNNSASWNSLFMNIDSVLQSVSNEFSVKKSDILDIESDSMATKLALAETHVINETKKYLEEEGICLDAFNDMKERSKNIILIKNIPFETESREIWHLFGKFGTLSRVLIPPTKTVAVVEFLESSEAKAAFRSLAYAKFKHVPLFLEWAPVGLLTEKKMKEAKINPAELKLVETALDEESAVIFVKNLNFNTTSETLRNVFHNKGVIKSCRIATKKDMKNPGSLLSLGFGFVEFASKEEAKNAIASLQGIELEGHALQLKFSNNNGAVQGQLRVNSKSNVSSSSSSNSTKLIVRNIPFEATEKEIRELFKSCGQLKRVRLPRKFDGNHRGFGFVEFLTKSEAQNAYQSLAHTHLYGRHLVMEWAKDEDNNIEELRKRASKEYSGIAKRAKVELEEEEAGSDLE